MRNHPSKIMSDLSQSQTLHTQNHPLSYKTVNKTEADKLRQDLTSTHQKPKHLNTTSSTTLTKPISPYPLLTYGERLYYKNLAKKDLHKLKSKTQLAQTEREFHQTHLFHPVLNTNFPSKKATSTYHNTRSSTAKPKKHIISSFAKKEQEDLHEIQKHSLNAKPVNSRHIFELSERLHNENKQMNLKKENLAKTYHQHECPFMPKIIDTSGTKPSIDNFFNRLQTWFDCFHKKLEENYNKQLVDEKNNQKLFTPRIYSNHPGRHDTFEFLFNQYGSLKAKKEQQEKDSVNNYIKLSNTKKISESSEKLYSEMKKKLIEKLYLLFDTQNTGTIAFDEHTTSVLNELQDKHAPTYMLFNNIFQQCKDNNIQLNQIQFYCMLDWVFEHMDIETKRDIFSFTKQQFCSVDESNEQRNTKDSSINKDKQHKPKQTQKIIEISEVQTPRSN